LFLARQQSDPITVSAPGGQASLSIDRVDGADTGAPLLAVQQSDPITPSAPGGQAVLGIACGDMTGFRVTGGTIEVPAL